MDDYRYRKATITRGEPGYAKYKMENGIAVKKEKNATMPIQISDDGRGVITIKSLILRI